MRQNLLKFLSYLFLGLLIVILLFVLWGSYFLRPNQAVKPDPVFRAAIFPHHDLLLNYFDGFYQDFSASDQGQTKKVIIFSPNHHQSELAKIETDERIVKADHGVTIHWPFINKYFPEAEIENILLTRSTPQIKLDELVDQLNQKIGQQPTSVIASVDFSHYLNATQADELDARTQALICNKEAEKILHLNDDYLDCPACVYVLLNLEIIKEYSVGCPEIIFHGNSSQFYPSGENDSFTTSYFAMKWKSINQPVELAKPLQPQHTKLLFTGDLSFDRYFRQIAAQKNYDFILQDLGEFLKEFDGVVSNLESPITDYQSVSENSIIGTRDNYIFTSPPETAQILSAHNIKILNLGNNHILNFGREGLAQTLSYLSSADIEFFGNAEGLISPSYLIKEINGIRIGFVNYNQFAANSIDKTMTDIELVKSDSDVIILFAHWGEEYELEANSFIKDLAHKFIEQGVDLIIGSHPHVIQPLEIYQDKPIYYSLGNFVFDQYFSPETRRGLLVEVDIDSNGIITNTKKHFVNLQTNGKTTFE